MKKLAIMISFALLFATGADADALARVYFKTDGTGNGTTWTTASSDLADYLSSVSMDTSLNVEVWVAAGTYKRGTASVTNGVFKLTKGVKMYGGFKGDEQSLESRDWGANPTILDGENKYIVIDGLKDATPADTVINGFTVTGGNLAYYGGGMHNVTSSPTVENCTFSGNKAEKGGAGMYNSNSSPTVVNCTFNGNTATEGGAMYNLNSSPAVVNCTFSGNTASGDRSPGGGLFNFNSSPTIVNCTFSGNTATTAGAMYSVNNSKPTVANSIFWGNAGGEIGELGSVTTLKNCVVKDGFEGGTDIITADPKLLSADISGDVTTDDAKFYIYKPDAGSSAINAGLPVGTVVSGDVKVPDKDQLGAERAAAPAKVTIGSCENIGAPDPDPDPDPDNPGGGDSPVNPITPPKAPEDAKNIEALSPEYTILSSDATDEEKQAAVDTAAALLTSIPPDALEVGGNGAVRVKSDVARGLSKKVGVNAGKVVGIPVFSATLNTAGDVLMTAFKMSGAHLYADTPKNVKVMKILSESDSELFVYTDTPSEFGDRKFTVYRMNDTLVPKDAELDPSMNYKLVLFVKDTGEFDLNSADLHVSDPAAVLEQKTGGGGGSSGCTAAYAPFALLLALPLAAPLFLRRKK